NNVISRMVREVRKFGIALVMLLQPPLDMLDPGILENLGTIVMLSGGHQYVSHLLNVISGIDGDDASWLLSGQYRALVMRHGARPIRLVRLYVPKGLLKDYVIKEK
ncbi:MAG: AAA family ATPase, partial [Vulcanisaeta sp.]